MLHLRSPFVMLTSASGMPLPAAEPAYIEYLWRQYEAERQFDAKKRQRLGYFDNPELPLRLARPEWWL